MPCNFVADGFHTKNLCNRVSSSEVRFYREKRPFCGFHPPPPGAGGGRGLGAKYIVHLRAHYKVRSGLPTSANWTFLLGVTAEALRAKIDWKSASCKGVGQHPQFSRRRRRTLPIIFARIDKPMNALHLFADSFHTNKLCSRLSSSEVRF